MRAWSSIPPNEPYEHLFSYLACIIRRLSIDRCRHESRLKRDGAVISLSNELEECLTSPHTVESQMNDREFVSALNEFLEAQPQEKRVMFVRRYFYADSIEDIAERYSVSASKVTSALFRMRKALSRRLSQNQ